MVDYDYDIGVIGGGAAGLTVTSGAAQLGAKTLLIEKKERLGGDCLHFGCVPSKTLIKTANVYHMMKHAEKYGLPTVQVPPIDFKKVSDRIKSVIEGIQAHDSAERFCRLGAKVEFGRPVFSDEHSVQLNGKTVSARNWVIATGSSPFIPPVKGLDETGYITNKELFYLDRLPKSMVIIGGGPIGSEMGQAFNRLGTKVYVVNQGDQILGKEDKDMADTVKKVMESEGVAFYLNASIEAARDLGSEKEVVITDKEGKSVILKVETIMVAAGRTPNIGQMGLEHIGIKVSRFGIDVDKRLRTNHKHIYAAGDVNGGYLFTHAAGYEGGIVVSNAVFRFPRSTDYTYLPWCTYTDPELASIGMNEKTAESKGIEYSIIVEEFKNNDRSLAEGEKIGKIKMLLDEKEKPIGVQIVGPHAGDLVCEWVAVLNGKVKLSTLAAAVHPYPTIGEINKKVAGTFFTPKIFSDKIKKGLKFFFNLKGRACGLESDKE
ncbi:MAG: FAD-dependent oxidoreductase [Desulfobacterales bacterium]|jgi:pyruvate/2-oxoglutarate dehydrogenase complex dihydrolipoamide dehydrogenase (E3) component|nr:FAD-dependent oxidoreductase [Desulfobacterales bacterium]